MSWAKTDAHTIFRFSGQPQSTANLELSQLKKVKGQDYDVNISVDDK